MFDDLQIYERRERMLVGCADALLGVVTAPGRLGTRPAPSAAPTRILVLRLERIGDLLMALPALDALRQRAPQASIHLVVGSWNAPIAQMLPGVDSFDTLDAPWLARHTAGNTPRALAARAWSWRRRAFDLAINFEPDIRSNLLIGLSGAVRRVGFRSGGGGHLLTDALAYDPRAHTATNLVRLVTTAVPASEPYVAGQPQRLRVPDAARAAAAALLPTPTDAVPRVGVHVSGGRAIKQWGLDRFAAVATRVARERRAQLIFTGTVDDRPLVDRVVAQLPPDVARTNLAGTMSLDVFAALLGQLDLFITGDTGPMHLAAAVNTPLVAIFGPSDPARYSPLSDRARIVTTPLWCRPCNRIRRPPARCLVGTPDCLDGVTVDAVVHAALEQLRPRP